MFSRVERRAVRVSVCLVMSSMWLMLTCGDKYFPSVVMEEGGMENWKNLRVWGRQEGKDDS